MKNSIGLALCLCLLGLSAGCAESLPLGSPLPFKVGILTGTVSQGEDEVRAAEALKELYPGVIVHRTYPDNFMQEQDTTISQITGLAADPLVKVIVIGQAVPGTVAAVRKVRETRTDILFGFVEPHDEPIMVNRTADIALQPDQPARGRAIPDKAKEIGAKTFVHYSFPRHMSMPFIAERERIMKERCKEIGLEYVFVSAPDPMAEGGLPATQQYVLESVPQLVKKYGPDTAFFSTNCGMQDPLIKAVLDGKAIYAEPCCPSPTHGFPTALGIAIPPEMAGNFDFINEQNAKAIADRGLSGRFVTWPVPAVIASIRAVTKILVDTELGKDVYKDPKLLAKYKYDPDAGLPANAYKDLDTVRRYVEAEAGTKVKLGRFDDVKGNYYLLLIEQRVY